MTKEKLEKEAEVFASYYESLFPNEFGTFYKAFLKVAEPREKRIEELEKDKAYAEEQLDEQIQATLKLQKENAELKVDYKVLSCSVGDFGELQDKLEEEQRKNNGLSDNLTKAKVLLEKLLLVSCNSDVLIQYPNCSEVLQTRVEAEQFLKEIEK